MKIQLILLGMLISLGSYGQDVQGGVKAGILSAGMNGEANESLTGLLNFTKGSVKTQNHTGFFAGGYLTIPVSGSISVEPGVYFSQKGYELRGKIPVKEVQLLDPSAKAVLKNNYIDLPVHLRMNAGNFHIFAGPQISYLLNSTMSAKAGILGFNLLNTSMDTKTIMNEWDASVTAGAGFQIAPGLLLSASYEQGLLKADAGRQTQVFNRAIRAGITIEF